MEVAPEPVEVNENGNGHVANGIGPSVELVMGNGPATNGNGLHANGNSHAGGRDEGQQSLFSWAEFMAEEPMKLSRNAKPKPSSLSLFEWAFTLEREEEMVGAGS